MRSSRFFERRRILAAEITAAGETHARGRANVDRARTYHTGGPERAPDCTFASTCASERAHGQRWRACDACDA
ncbi:unnamed protein product [Lampetra planeri]